MSGLHTKAIHAGFDRDSLVSKGASPLWIPRGSPRFAGLAASVGIRGLRPRRRQSLRSIVAADHPSVGRSLAFARSYGCVP